MIRIERLVMRQFSSCINFLNDSMEPEALAELIEIYSTTAIDVNDVKELRTICLSYLRIDLC